MKVATIKYQSVGNFKGVSTSLYVSGCHHACEGCFNKETWNRNYGYDYTEEVENEIIDSLKPSYIQSLILLGGEPLMPYNIEPLIRLCRRVREEIGDKRIVLFSGYTYEQILQDEKKLELLHLVDVLIDGRFEIEKYDIRLNWRGSSNQRIIDVKASLSSGKVIWYQD